MIIPDVKGGIVVFLIFVCLADSLIDLTQYLFQSLQDGKCLLSSSRLLALRCKESAADQAAVFLGSVTGSASP